MVGGGGELLPPLPVVICALLRERAFALARSDELGRLRAMVVDSGLHHRRVRCRLRRRLQLGHLTHLTVFHITSSWFGSASTHDAEVLPGCPRNESKIPGYVRAYSSS